MTTISILNHAIKLNSKEIAKHQSELALFKREARQWKGMAEKAFYISALGDIQRCRRRLAKAQDMQARIYVEIEAIHRSARIVRKYVDLFGFIQSGADRTSIEQEAMLDALLAEREELRMEKVLDPS